MSHSFSPEKRVREGLRVVFNTTGPSLTTQSHRDETDINNIVRRFHRTGELPKQRTPQYADISAVQQLDPTSAIDLSRSTLKTAHENAQKHLLQKREEQQKIEHEKLVDKIKSDLKAEAATPPSA